MKVKISNANDLRANDVWLGLTCIEVDGDRVRFSPEDDPLVVTRRAVNTLIAAGNDTVERKPEKVEFEAMIRGCGRGGCGEIFPDNEFLGMGNHAQGLDVLIGKRVKVTVEPLE